MVMAPAGPAPIMATDLIGAIVKALDQIRNTVQRQVEVWLVRENCMKYAPKRGDLEGVCKSDLRDKERPHVEQLGSICTCTITRYD